MDLNLKDKVILITGGAKGIGFGIAQTVANEGAIAVIIGRKEVDNKNAIDLIMKNGGKAFGIEAELTSPECCEKAVQRTITEFGRIDGLVNNAGLNDGVGLENGNYEGFLQSLHRNLIHYYLMAHHALPELIKSKGSIVNISSKTGETGQGNTSAYAASNGGRNALTREWAVELLKYGIRVNALVVAECWTPQYQNWIKTLNNPQETLNKITANIPLENRMTTTQEIGNAVAFLLSNKSSHTTGQIIYVDGGYVHLDRALVNA
ncbi:SDR family oxidoreductase [Albibacterium sp.]|uniref:SDR family oxidoreductase n=1 Tax=Albibacterium sp. TaxID=2952885 RepID=UPI002C14D69F|nr:SDR family oxidoreductase [Albibacterium sp.]HUH19452.1 SDR family oxidoreductase [Albibacterium sp.]